jgi:NifU-like protein involved in Fe-S cluster formation
MNNRLFNQDEIEGFQQTLMDRSKKFQAQVIEISEPVTLVKNPVCGDQLEWAQSIIDAQGKLNLQMRGMGCVVSMGTMSLFLDILKGKSLKQAVLILEQFVDFWKDETFVFTDESLEVLNYYRLFQNSPHKQTCASFWQKKLVQEISIITDSK